MRKLYTFLFLLMCSLLMQAQTAVIILSDTALKTIGATAKEFALPKPGARLTFLASHKPSAVTTDKKLMGNLKVEQKVNGKWETLYDDNPGIVTVGERKVLGATVSTYEESVAFESLGFDLNRRATAIRFTGALVQEKYIKNLQVTMASFVEVSPKAVNMGEMVVWSEPVTKRFAVEHCNVARLSISSSNQDFALETTSVAGSGIGQYATDSFAVTFTPNIMGQHQTTIVVSNGTQTDSIHFYAKVTKRTPIFTMATELMTVGDTIEAPLSSDCTNAFMLASCDGAVVEISCGQMIARSAGEAVVTAMQLGDDAYWNNKVETYTITVQPAPIVPTEVSGVTASADIRFDGSTLLVEANELKSVAIYDVQGQLAEEHSCEGSLSTRLYLPAGVYTVVARVGQNVRSEKIVVE